MRIISGQYGGRVIHPPMKGWPTRPTTDLAREALFNILQNTIDLDQARVLDLFGGTAAISMECISRGCKDVTYVEQYGKCISWVKELMATFALEGRLLIRKNDVKRFLLSEQGTYDLVFADPPYELPWLDQLPALIFDRQLVRPDGLVVIEHSAATDLSEHPNYEKSKKYGQTMFSFFTVPDQG